MIPILEFPVSCPIWFCGIAAIWSILQGMTGYQYGLYIFDKAALEFKAKDSNEKSETPLRPTISKGVRAGAYGGHHAALYSLCALAGFAAWAGVARIADGMTTWPSVDGGRVALLVALGGFAVAGVSGALPRILYLGGRPV